MAAIDSYVHILRAVVPIFRRSTADLGLNLRGIQRFSLRHNARSTLAPARPLAVIRIPAECL